VHKTVQKCAKRCKSAQNGAKVHKTVQKCTKRCKSAQNGAKSVHNGAKALLSLRLMHFGSKQNLNIKTNFITTAEYQILEK
jgi:hypothetical protein